MDHNDRDTDKRAGEPSGLPPRVRVRGWVLLLLLALFGVLVGYHWAGLLPPVNDVGAYLPFASWPPLVQLTCVAFVLISVLAALKIVVNSHQKME
jgi:hypothetical protein